MFCQHVLILGSRSILLFGPILGLAALPASAQQPIAYVPTQGVSLSGSLSVADGKASIGNNGSITAGDQTAKLTPIFAESDQKRQALFQDQSITVGQMREQMKSIHQNTEQQLATVLSPDQLQQLKSMRHGRRGEIGRAHV